MMTAGNEEGTTLRPLTMLIAMLLLVAGCANAEETDHRLGRIVVSDVGTGYEVVEPPASGPMNLDAAASATSAGGSRLRRQLSTTGFQEGYSRVWRKANDDFVAVLVFQFLTQRRAEELVEFMGLEHEDKRSAQRFAIARIPGAVGYILNARTPGAATSLFCNMAWFPQDNMTFEVRTCTAQPGSTEPTVDLAIRQFEAVGGTPLSPEEAEELLEREEESPEEQSPEEPAGDGDPAPPEDAPPD